MINKSFLVYYILFIITCIAVGLSLGMVVNGEYFSNRSVNLGSDFMKNVLSSNLKNFISYLFLPFISPILQLLDLVETFFKIGVGIQVAGLFSTMNDLIPHALLEIPNFIWYQGASQYVLFTFLKEKSIKKIIYLEKKLFKFYLLSLFVLIIAAFIEGYVG
ncbi:MAG: stage II sporulation protein M [Lactobacillales bacterium]|jgi:uncharacterized membrane protein SpoIIM required for sporulation|nr:stage II sporulation protein M [Lactobacillales bacterium]